MDRYEWFMGDHDDVKEAENVHHCHKYRSNRFGRGHLEKTLARVRVCLHILLCMAHGGQKRDFWPFQAPNPENCVSSGSSCCLL